MKYILFISIIIFSSCMSSSQKKDNDNPKNIDSFSKVGTITEENSSLQENSVKFLWRENEYDPELKDSVSKIIINEELCKTLTEPQRAALGFVVTFIGSDCDWDGEANSDFSNLKCKTLDALNLGYQCSDKHLGFLRKWFRNDPKSLKELEDCPTVPYTASSQNTFDYINLKSNGNNIYVEFAANGVNMKKGESWSWNETDHFKVDNDQIKLIKKQESKVKREHFDN